MTASNAFGDCKKAALHRTTAIQSNGALIAIDVHSQVIGACSDNLHDFLGMPVSSVLGQTAHSVFGKDWAKLARLASQLGRHQVGDLLTADARVLTVAGHRQGDYMLLEFERAQAHSPSWWNHAARAVFLDALSNVRSIAQCVKLLVDTVFTNSGLDRVMCYRFLPGWHGEVIHEACRPGVDGFLGLRFPAGDVPANVRQLYALNWQRMIADVDAKTASLLYWGDEDQALDMTYSILRAVHPVHIKYLHNMGVQASMSLSLVVNGKLWGLVACHHLAPMDLSIHERLALEEVAKLISLHLKNLVSLIEQEQQSKLREKLSQVRGALQALTENPKSGLALNLGSMRELFRANGIWLHFDGEEHFAGLTPDLQALVPLRDWLELLPKDQISHYQQLPETLTRHPAIARNASGLMYIPLSASDFLVLMRLEVVEVVHWAGQPASLDENDARSLTPRNSFATWAQQVRYTAEPWSDSELVCSESLRRELIDYINLSRLEQVALRDPLTNLANRLLFEKRMQQEVRNAFSKGSQFAVHMIDLDKFKPVNDTLGHPAGDALLRAVAQRLLALVRTDDTVARLGGDEFAVIQAGVAGAEAASRMADKIVREVAKPYEILGHAVEIGASVGVALFPADSADEAELLVQADLALYAVKKAGRNAFSLFVPTMRESSERTLDAEALLLAIQSDQLVLHFQPIIDSRTGDLRGLESFVRWHHPEKGLMAAEQFLPLAQQLHLAPQIGNWVLNAVFQQQKVWRNKGLTTVPVTVNISSPQFSSQDLLGQIKSLGTQHDIGWEWLRLDIKEEAILKDVNQAIRKLSNLRDNGVAAQLDNFGRGFVSLGFMTQLPLIAIKFDASALRIQDDSSMSLAVLNILKGIARVLNAKLAFTRVESSVAAKWLRQQDADLIQGYAVSVPQGAEQVEQWLANPRIVIADHPVE
jgi:chemotaxis family two-component system sensor kinase Cph1